MINSPDKTSEESSKGGNAYVPREVEERWTNYWHENKLFNLDVHPDKPRF